jgi:hypothetical protein
MTSVTENASRYVGYWHEADILFADLDVSY